MATMSTVHKAREHLFAATNANTTAHQKALQRHREQRAKLKAEREKREAEAAVAALGDQSA